MTMLSPEQREPEKRPNILFIITDQQQWKMMNCAGNEYLHTPAMDSLAANGVQFDRAYAANPTCVPSRMSMFMGLMPSRMNMIENPSENCFITDEMRRNSLGWLMQYAGYDVGYAGKVHLSIKNTPRSLGFTNYLTWDQRDECAEVSAEFIKQERDKPFFLVTSLINPHDICFMNIREFPVSERIRGFLERADMSLKEIDRILEERESISDEKFYADICPPLPENFEPIEDEPEAIEKFLESPSVKSVKCCREQWDEQKWRLHRYVYARLTERVDGQIAKVLEALRASGQEQNTVVVFVSDHGDNDASRRITQKCMPYDESIRVPFIISRKGMKRAGEVDHSLVSTGLDLIPTFCDYAGIDPPSTSRGTSVRPRAEGLDRKDERDYVVVQTSISRTVITRDWQYITFCSGKNQEQLFHLKDDPHATRNLINEEHYKEKAEALRQILIDEIEAIDDNVGRDMLERSAEWKGLPLEIAGYMI